MTTKAIIFRFTRVAICQEKIENTKLSNSSNFQGQLVQEGGRDAEQYPGPPQHPVGPGQSGSRQVTTPGRVPSIGFTLSVLPRR